MARWSNVSSMEMSFVEGRFGGGGHELMEVVRVVSNDCLGVEGPVVAAVDIMIMVLINC